MEELENLVKGDGTMTLNPNNTAYIPKKHHEEKPTIVYTLTSCKCSTYCRVILFTSVILCSLHFYLLFNITFVGLV